MDFLNDMYHLCVSFYSESGIRRLWSAISGALSGEAPLDAGKHLLVWAAVLLVVGFAVDQVLYWTRPDHRALMVRPWRL